MAIYMRGGAPVEIVAAEERTRWMVARPGRRDAFDTRPTAKQIGKGELEQFQIWWVRIKYTGPYPDGSGKDQVGTTEPRFREAFDLVADDGIREIFDRCRDLAKIAA